MGAILVLNAGSSSVKFCVYGWAHGRPRRIVKGQISGIGIHAAFTASGPDGREERRWDDAAQPTRTELSRFLVDWLRQRLQGQTLVAVGHRVVHGGTRFREPVLVDADVLEGLEALVPLAPLHQPHSLAFIRAFAEAHPGLAQIACFDTAFHRTVSDAEALFALPASLADKGIRRYGFHGLSYEYVSGELARVSPADAAGKTVVAHLGSGASMCAIDHGRSVASTMGFTALDGLIMGTRCGALDPGVVLHLIEREGMSPAEVTRLLYNGSGLLGLSGTSNDMRDLLGSEEPRARLAVDLFVNRVVREAGSLAAAQGGLDALVFTAGIGERAPEIRARVSARLAFLGVELDEEANRAADGTQDARISSARSRVAVWVIPTDEEAMIATHTRQLTQQLTGQNAPVSAMAHEPAQAEAHAA
ncbi:acetate/propionate family kinase [Azospirillum sp. SYSU D00513]|uniref:acetate/propionate family kinase n=1 Tax=Azospirillum sp. SYSU D00513 TaxID=2812561 RepID=UPI001A958607|nr:acetate/propionate family kinase [Azospirillum sp. SYSU D00513]